MKTNYDFSNSTKNPYIEKLPDSDTISAAARADYCRAIKLASTQKNQTIYRTTGDRYFQNDGFMTHQEVVDHIQWWNEEEPETDHSDIWDAVTEVES
jgi:hypothetical protein